MTRPAQGLLAVGLVGALLCWLVLGAMPAYFAAWLFWIGVPMGALPIVMTMEASAATASPLLPVLRSMLPLLPLGTVLALPMLGGLSGLFARPDLPGALPAWWTTPGTLALRDGASLIVLSLMAILFWTRPGRPRRAIAVAGVLATLVLVTLLAVDVVLAPQPALGSSLAGLLLIAGQMALAGSLAGLVVAVGSRPSARLPGGMGLLLGLLVTGWFFLQFIQFLVVWSANLPAEAGWYLDRLGGLGTAGIAFAAIAALAAMALLPSMLGRIPVVMATLAAMIVLAALVMTLLFVIPAYRGGLTLTLADVAALVGVGGLVIGALLLLLPEEDRHEVA